MNQFGRHIITGIEGTRLSQRERELFSIIRPSGIILFKHNIIKDPAWTSALSELIQEVRNCIGQQDIFISVDHEGGKVHRFPEPITHFPPACYWQTLAREVGSAMGQELAALGVNLNFAPILDIDLEPKNTVIAKRAFSSDPVLVAEYSRQFIEGLHSAGVMACGKHFPGHGATTVDSHFALPVLTCAASVMENRELVPFKSAIAHQIPMLMTAHVLYPEIDPLFPATLSPSIIGSLLRQKLGFTGTVVSDALEMGALSATDQAESLSSLLRAGVDLALFATPSGQAPIEAAFAATLRAEENLKNGLLDANLSTLSESRINEAFLRLRSIRVEAKCSTSEILGQLSHQDLLYRLATNSQFPKETHQLS